MTVRGGLLLFALPTLSLPFAPCPERERVQAAGPHLAAALAAFKKNFPARLKAICATLDDGVEVEVWWQDEARVGQKNKITRRWAKRGTRPSAPKDQRTTSAYIFGAICPNKGKAAGLTRISHRV